MLCAVWSARLRNLCVRARLVSSHVASANQLNILTSVEKLLASTDPYGSISSSINPWVLRLYKQYKIDPIKKNDPLRKACHKTEQFLQALNKAGNGYNKFLPIRYDALRNSVAESCGKLLASCKTDREYQTVAAIMTLLVPKSSTMWLSYDLAMKELLDKNLCSVDAGLLAVNALTTAKKHHTYHRRIHCNTAVLDLISRQKRSRDENVFEAVALPVDSTSNGDHSCVPSKELFASIGSGVVRDSRELERFGLILNLLASTPSVGKTHPVLIRDVCDFGVKAFSMLQNPVRLSTLKVIWQHAPDANLKGSYLLYKTLYDQVLYSINSEPMQLLHEEAAIAQLLHSMARSKFKSEQLINKLYLVMKNQGMSFNSMGMEIFGHLIELEAMPFAMSVLDQCMKQSMTSTSFDVNSYKKSADSGIALSDKAKELLFDHLRKKTDYHFRDLSLLLQHAGRTEHHKAFHQLLHRVEICLTNTAAELSPSEAVNLLRSYGSTGRNYPPIVTSLNSIIHKNVNEMSIDVLSAAVWASARLNDREAQYIDSAVSKYFAHLDTAKVLNRKSLLTLVLMLWSMSCLEKMEARHFITAKNMIEAFLSSNQVDSTFQLQQLTQVWNEAQIILDNSKSISQSYGSEVPSALKKLPWYARTAMLNDDVDSSRTHMDASRLLNQLGVSHDNEKQMSNGYVVDIFIPVSSLTRATGHDQTLCFTSAVNAVEDMNTTVPGWLRAMAGVSSQAVLSGGPKHMGQINGVVLEFDGPHHFESYLRRETGPTVMKRRHLQSLGMVVMNLPFWAYNLDMSENNRMALIRQCIARVTTPATTNKPVNMESSTAANK